MCHLQLPSLISLCLSSPKSKLSPSTSLKSSQAVTQQLPHDDSESTGDILIRRLRAASQSPAAGVSGAGGAGVLTRRPMQVEELRRQEACAGGGVQVGGGVISLLPPLRARGARACRP
jgi:hypothetical protein